VDIRNLPAARPKNIGSFRYRVIQQRQSHGHSESRRNIRHGFVQIAVCEKQGKIQGPEVLAAEATDGGSLHVLAFRGRR